MKAKREQVQYQSLETQVTTTKGHTHDGDQYKKNQNIVQNILISLIIALSIVLVCMLNMAYTEYKGRSESPVTINSNPVLNNTGANQAENKKLEELAKQQKSLQAEFDAYKKDSEKKLQEALNAENAEIAKLKKSITQNNRSNQAEQTEEGQKTVITQKSTPGHRKFIPFKFSSSILLVSNLTFISASFE